ncbi:MAG: PhnD/SsuA/transferrin family substrate-binding protein [Planctomycetes bacterium]|nr:PhnD/SsuA/transferrin family substrate-binding protein [Planctomycetota bacterium]
MRRPSIACCALLCALSACRGDSPEVSPAAEVLRFSVIPDWNKGRLAENAARLAELLTARLGVEVRYEPANDYTACVNGLAANKLDFVWLGGKTTCDAIDVGAGHVHVLATRDIDLHFKSYFIGNRAALDAGRVAVVDDLAAWRGHTEGLRFTFGDVNSTSGHLMPRHFLLQAGIEPEQAFASVGYAEGGHSGTLEAVAAGAVDLGALNFAYYDRADEQLRERAPLLFTTPEYVDYAWVAHDRVGADRVAKLREVLLGLDRAHGDDEAAVLDAWSAGAFVGARDEQWQAIRAVRDGLPKGFLK